ncbi:NAD-dependent epimerase/dehydratase family protein [Gemmatimonadota bacterium]
MPKKILVIGSEGNIGKPLVKHLKTGGYDVLASDIKPGWRKDYLMADINHPLDLLPAFDWGPDVVILLAAVVSRVTCEQAGSLAVATNLAGVQNVLELCKRSGAKVVYFSTSEVYGPDCDPMDEAAADPSPNNRYGLLKYLGEKLVEYEVKVNALKAVTLRPFMFYDEYEDIGDHRSAMIRFATNLARSEPITVHTGSSRGWMHISDAVRCIEAAAGLDEYAVINIGHPDQVPIEQLAEMIRSELGASKDLIHHSELPSGMTLVKIPVLNRQRELLGIEPAVSLRDGVRRVCNVIRNRANVQGIQS